MATDGRLRKQRRLLGPQQKQEQGPRVETQKTKNTRRDMNPWRKANPRRWHGKDRIAPPSPPESSSCLRQRFDSSTHTPSIRSPLSEPGAPQKARHPGG